MYRLLFAIGIISAIFPATSGADEDKRLYGAWKPVIYNIQGTEYPMQGLMIITPRYFIGNTIFKTSDSSPADANANAGPYEIVNGSIVINQWMQLHWRPSAQKEHFLAQDIVEEIPYEIKGGRLIFHFPSGNTYISEKLPD